MMTVANANHPAKAILPELPSNLRASSWSQQETQRVWSHGGIGTIGSWGTYGGPCGSHLNSAQGIWSSSLR